MQELLPMIAMSYSSLLKHSCEEKKIFKKVGNMYIVIDCLVTGSVTILQVCDTIGDGPFY